MPLRDGDYDVHPGLETAEARSPLTQAFDRLDREIEHLAKVRMALHQKLGPVRLDSPKADSREGDKMPARPMSAPVVNTIHDFADRVQAEALAVEAITREVQL